MQCEMCGKSFDTLLSVKVEGVTMQLCEKCSVYGEKVKNVQHPSSKEKPKNNANFYNKPQDIISKHVEFVDIHSSERIQKRRIEMGMKQKDLARFLNEKESIIHQLESGHLKPSQQLIDKIKGKMGINLLQTIDIDEDTSTQNQSSKSEAEYTLGDFIKKK